MCLLSIIALSVMGRVTPLVEPIVVQAAHTRGSWILPCEIDGKAVRLLLVDEQRSSISSKVAKSFGLDIATDHGITLSGHELSRTVFQTYDLPNERDTYDGLIGFDAIQSCAVGFDMTTRKVTIWPGGVDPVAAKAWVESGKVRLGAVGPVKSLEATLGPDPNGHASVETRIGGESLIARVLISSEAPFVPSSALKNTKLIEYNEPDTKRRCFFSNDFSFGALAPGFIYVTGDQPPDQYEPEEAYLGVEYLNSNRVILDFENEEIYEQILDPVSLLAKSWAWSLGVPVYVDKNDLRLGPLCEFPVAPEMLPVLREGEKLDSVRGIPASKLLKLLKRGSLFSYSDMKELYDLLSDGPMSLSVIRDGKVIEFSLDP